jgi:hypothetical protein
MFKMSSICIRAVNFDKEVSFNIDVPKIKEELLI